MIGVSAGNIRGPEKDSFLPGSKSLQKFRAGLPFGSGRKTWSFMIVVKNCVLFVSSETFGRTNKNMNTLKNSSTTLLSTGRSTRSKSVTLFVTALLLAMLVGSVAAQAQTATLVVTVINAGRFYGDSNPEFTGTISGLAEIGRASCRER